MWSLCVELDSAAGQPAVCIYWRHCDTLWTLPDHQHQHHRRRRAQNVRRFRSNEKLLSAHNEVARAGKGRAAIMRMKTNHRRTHYEVHDGTVRRMRTRDPSGVRLSSVRLSSLIETNDITRLLAIFRQSFASPLPPVTRNFMTTTRPDSDLCRQSFADYLCLCAACVVLSVCVRSPVKTTAVCSRCYRMLRSASAIALLATQAQEGAACKQSY